MSTNRETIKADNNPDVHITSFSGGTERGRCLQLGQTLPNSGITHNYGYGSVQLTEEQAAVLALDILDWLDK